MAKQKPSSSLDLSTWIDQRQSQGLYHFNREEALKTLNTSETALKQAATRLIKKNRIVRVYSGFYIIVPLEYASTGVLPAEWFIADLMDYVSTLLCRALKCSGSPRCSPSAATAVSSGNR